MTAAPFPLSWPDHIDRAGRREKSQFRTELPGAIKNVRASLAAFGRDSGKAVTDVVISSNVTLGVEKPEDPGVAVWFTWEGLAVSIPVDRYTTPAENLQAIHHVLEARRTELRHGTLALVKASLRGFTALPAPAGRPKRSPWYRELGVSQTATTAEINAAWRKRSAEAHPDRPGGSHDEMSKVNAARDEGISLNGDV